MDLIIENRIRNRSSYKTFLILNEQLKSEGIDNPKHRCIALKYIHKTMDETHSYRSETNAVYAEESLNLLIKDKELI